MTDRRSFLHGASVLMGSAALGPVLAAFAAGPRPSYFLNDAEMRTLRILVDLILPATDSPAASAAETHIFISMAIPACAPPDAQRVFRAGLRSLAGIEQMTPERQVAALKAHADAGQSLPYEDSFFHILKDYTMTGYFLSEVGATQALAYEKIPGGFQGDLPLQPGQKAWAI